VPLPPYALPATALPLYLVWGKHKIINIKLTISVILIILIICHVFITTAAAATTKQQL